MVKITSLALLALVVVVACAPFTPKYAITLPEKHATLANGLRVIVLPDDSTDLVEVDVRYAVGSADDPAGRAGLAHLVEHLMFDQRQAGADKPPLGAVLRQHSIDFNAYTVWDSTHYMTLAGKQEVDLLLGLEAARLNTGCHSIDEATFEREREVVRNEIRQRAGSPEAQIDYKILEDVYPAGHPYRRMTGGDDAQLASITLDDVCKFMDAYYVPARATVIIAGSVSDDAARAAIDRWLAPLPARAGAPRVATPDFVLPHTTVTHEMDVEETSVFVVWKLPPRFSPDEEAMQFGIGALFGRTASAGHRWEFATSVSPHVLGGAYGQVLALQVSLEDPSHVDEAVAAVLRSARSAHRGIRFIEADQLREIKARETADLALGFESLSARTNAYADYSQFDADGHYFAGDLERIRALDVDRIDDTVSAVLDPDKAMIIVIKAKKDARTGYQRAGLKFSAGGAAAREDFPVDRAEAAHAIPVPPHPTTIAVARTFTLKNGLRVVLLPSTSPLPVVTASLVFGVGSAHEPPDLAGLATVAALRLSPSESTGDTLGYVGLQIRPAIDRDATMFTVRGLNLYLEFMVHGLEREVRVGDYSQEGIESWQHLRSLALEKQPMRARLAFERAFLDAVLGPNHPYTVTGTPTAASYLRLGRDEAVSFRDRHFQAKNATLVITGSFDAKLAERYAHAAFDGWDAGPSDAPITAPPADHPSPRYVAVSGPERPLIDVRMAYPAPSGIDEHHAARLVLAAMLNHRVGVVRDRLGASYGVYARYEAHSGPGMYEIGGSLDAERGGEALTAMRAGIDGLRRGEDFLDDFVRARRDVLAKLVVKQTDASAVAERLVTMAIFHLPPSFDDELVEKVAGLTPSDVMRVVNRELRPELETIVCLGPPAAVAKAYADAKLAPVQVIDVK